GSALALIALFSAGAAAADAEQGARGEGRPVSPLSFISGAGAGGGSTSFHFKESTPDSSADFSSGGFEYTVGLDVNLHQERLLASFEYQSIQVSEDRETVSLRNDGEITDSLEPKHRRVAASLAWQTAGPWAGKYRIEGGYRWLSTDF